MNLNSENQTEINQARPKQKILTFALLIIFLATLAFIFYSYQIYEKYYFMSDKATTDEITPTTETNSIAPTPSPRNDIVTILETKILPTTTAKPIATKSPSPKQQATITPAISKNNSTCTISVVADSNSASNARLVAGASIANNTYIKSAQWDFDGNGSWDTDMSISNQSIVHNYSNGNYVAKLKLQMSDDTITDVCSKNFTMPFGFTVSLTGNVYEDINCNNMKEPSEKGLGGVSVAITNMENYSTLATLTSDSNGYYQFTRVLSGNDLVTIQPYDTPLSNYGVTQTRHQITLSSSQSSSNMDLGQIPSPVYEYCH